MCRNKTATRSYQPLKRILVRGSFSFIDLVVKRIRLISPPATSYLLFFHSKLWSRFSFTRVVVQNLFNHLLTLKWNFEFKWCEIKISCSFSWNNMKDMSMRFIVEVCLTHSNQKFWNLEIIQWTIQFWGLTFWLCSILSRFFTIVENIYRM